MPIHCYCTLAHLNWHPTSLEECSNKMVLPRLKKNIKALNWICVCVCVCVCGGGEPEVVKMPKVGTVLKNCSITVASKYQAIQDCIEQ